MKNSRSEFDRASWGVISEEQAEALWGALLEGASGRSRFDLPNVAYYFGALVVISAMGWFMSDAPVRGVGIFSIALTYTGVFVVVGWALRGRGLRVPGGLPATLAVCMVPLAVYGFERARGCGCRPTPASTRGFRLDPGRMVRHGGGDHRRRPRRPALFPVPVSNRPPRLLPMVHEHGPHPAPVRRGRLRPATLPKGLAVLRPRRLPCLVSRRPALGGAGSLRFLGLPVRDASLLGWVEHAGRRRNTTGSPTGR